MNGYWDFSSSGHLERGETLLQCAVRETEEECGVVVGPDSLRLTHIFHHDVGDWPYIDVLFTCDDFSGEVNTHELEKVANLRWFKPEDFPEELTTALAVFQRAGFPEVISYSYANEVNHKELVGREYEAGI